MARVFKILEVKHPRLKKVSVELVYYTDGAIKRHLSIPSGYRGPSRIPPYEGRQGRALMDTQEFLGKIKGPKKTTNKNIQGENRGAGLSKSTEMALAESRQKYG